MPYPGMLYRICKNMRAINIALGNRCVVIGFRSILYHGIPLNLATLQHPFVDLMMSSGVILNETKNSDATEILDNVKLVKTILSSSQGTMV
jgi:hypothetical protein